MPPKRKRRVSLTSEGLAPGEQLKRSTLPGNNSSSWGWVGTEVSRASDITPEHLLVSCGLSERNNHPFCFNKYSSNSQNVSKLKAEETRKVPLADGELDDDVIIISDDEGPPCGLKICKFNPNCLNYLGQENWEDEDEAVDAFMKALTLEEDPSLEVREPDFPVGLKNLGATCYANASLQVWFRDLAFRTGVYDCKPSNEVDTTFKESPIFQLQVTFSALQESTQGCFNPTKLVESLQLRTTEQQDAQEFSKLFMSHLDAEFKKQANPKVKSLVTDQFQGKQVYGTICNHCKYRSERVSDFLEIEISLKKNSNLRDRVEALLQPEVLSDDNQYFCSQCESLQDATRYIELKELPPVLHFSLLRFVYDLSTMERKKSKHSVSFPTTLDMRPFLGLNGQNLPTSSCNDNVYELRGVLLHKGSSAYYGHYEAQVYDTTNKSWFQCNDETITKIKALGESSQNRPMVVDIEDSDERPSNSQGRKNRANARKRRRIETDDEDTSSPTTIIDKKPNNKSESISSKDAYMLIYARKAPDLSNGSSLLENCDTTSPIPVPPSDALEVVNALNAAHDETCDAYGKKKKLIKARFLERRRKVMDIYRRWNIDSANADSLLVSRQALLAWLSQHQDKYASTIATAESEEKSARKRIHLGDIICTHAAVDPNKAKDIKRIGRQAYKDIVQDTGWEFEPELTIANICAECVRLSFIERLYQIEHPRLVAQFDRISEVASDLTGFWISKPWIKCWRQTKPKMHVISEADPSPDSNDFASDAAELLQKLYPSWRPLSTSCEICPVCDANIHISKESKREARKQAEDEKARLKDLHDVLLSGDTSIPENVPSSIIPVTFAKAWWQWLNRPTESARPDNIDNAAFFCEHDMLVIDPNSPTDLESSAMVIRRSDWDVLETIYLSGPLVAVEKQTQGEDAQRYTHEVPVCTECRLKWKSDWTSAEIIIRMGGAKPKLKPENDSKKGLQTYSKAGARQSKRLRQIKELGEKRRLTISKSTTVKEIKVMIQEELNIPTICQRLFHHEKELEDNAATVESLAIFAHDILDLKQESEVLELDDDSDTKEKRPRVEERGFGGTLLGGSRGVYRIPSSPTAASDGKEKSCSACTFSNDADALSCTICDTLFT
ncbi:hypothetical protein D9615_004069 [Tricholomella constricta]|uniref:ubiquitinyl hydrolase 1 n=1 Tax=Tricholomella constricta TaxID=117010 RepID=A0A8H5M4E5_9AGAR|nr:hypothetical protein D9615_004069 [Tricholomella constricta]